MHSGIIVGMRKLLLLSPAGGSAGIAPDGVCHSCHQLVFSCNSPPPPNAVGISSSHLDRWL